MSSVVRQLARRGEWLIIALAALVRLWRLSYHSLWFDEAVSLQWATSSPLWIWQKTVTLVEDKHPPGYYLLLHTWIGLLEPLGLANNDAALRLLGSLLGVLTVAGVLLLVRRLSGRAVALLAGLLVALSPLLVWYSQELRMFQPATTALVWAGCCLFLAWTSERRWPRWGWWLGLVFTLLAALYSYLFSAFVLPAVGLTLLLLWLATSRSGVPPSDGKGAQPSSTNHWRFVEGVLALAIVTVLFLPLAYNAWVVNGSEGEPGQAFAQFGQTLWRLLGVFTLWRGDWPAWLPTVSLGLFGLLAVAGLVAPATGRSAQVSGSSALSASYLDRGWLWLWLGIPLLIGNVLLASSASVFAEDRYFLFLTPFLLWAVARGAITLGQRPVWLGWGLGGVVAVLLLAALPRLWTPAMYREDWRAGANYIIHH